MSVHGFDDLIPHDGHECTVQVYVDQNDEAINASIECLDCNEVLLSYDKGESDEVVFDKALELTAEQKDDFVVGCCPKCGEKAYSPEVYEYDGDVAWNAYKCANCGTGWREIFQLVEVEKYPYEEV